MKDLKEYIKEGLFDDVDKLEGKNGLENNLKLLKKEINDWIKTNIKKSSGRIKLEYNKEFNKFVASYHVDSTVQILADIPEYLLLDFEVDWLYINAPTKNLLSHFINLKAYTLVTCTGTTIGEPLNPCIIDALWFSDELTKNEVDPKQLQIKHIWCDAEKSPVDIDLSVFKKFKDLIVTIKTCSGSKFDMDGLDIDKLHISESAASRRNCNIQISGNFDVDKFDCGLVNIDYKGSININELYADMSGTTLQVIKKVGTLYGESYLKESIINKIISGKLKVSKYIGGNRWSGESVSKEEYIISALEDLAYRIFEKIDTVYTDRKFVHTYIYNNEGFEQWAKDNKQYNIIASGVDRWFIFDKNNTKLIGFYFGILTGGRGLWTDDMDLIKELSVLQN